MLDCCVRLEVVKEEGLTFDQFLCLARCNGCILDVVQRVDLHRGPSYGGIETTGQGCHHHCEKVNAPNCYGDGKPENSMITEEVDMMVDADKANVFQEHLDKVSLAVFQILMPAFLYQIRFASSPCLLCCLSSVPFYSRTTIFKCDSEQLPRRFL